jgi:sugar phosphate isomerase/epimerase
MRKVILSSIALLIASAAFSQEIGLQLYSLRNEMKTDVPGSLAKVKEWGIKYVEGGGTSGMEMEAYKKLLKENNLQVVSVGADFNDLKTNPQKAVDNAKAFGAKYVVCYWIPHDGDNFTLENIREAVDVFSKAGKVLQENGLSLCYHPHGFEFRPHEGGTLFDYLVKNTDPKHFNFEMDVFWIKHPGQDPVTLLNKYPSRFLLMHLKDRKPGTPGNEFGRADVESNVVLGTGDVGIAEVMKAAKKVGVKYFFIEDESSRSVQQIPESLKFLRDLK